MSGILPRDEIRKAIMYVLSQNGKTISQIQDLTGRKYESDELQKDLYDKSCWLHRTDLIEYVAKILSIKQTFWGHKRESNKFHNTIDQEITKLRKNEIIMNLNNSKHFGIFRLKEYPSRPFPKPSPIINGRIPELTDQPKVLDMTTKNLKQKFLSIISKSAKSNTYKFTLAKSLLDYCRENSPNTNPTYVIPYEYFAGKFLRYYWYQEYKFKMKQDYRSNGKPKVIHAINDVFGTNPPGDFDLLDKHEIKKAEEKILKTVFGSIASKQSLVIPAFQEIPINKSTKEIRIFFDYDNVKKIIRLKPEAFEFFHKNNRILSKVVLAEWAKFLEKINLGLPRLIAKVENENILVRTALLSKYWKQYSPHFKHCFYCHNKLEYNYTNVDHFIPWSYIFDDNAWNLVLACKDCNCQKSDSLPKEEFLTMLIKRNENYSTKIPKLKLSLDQLDSGRGWELEIKNHYTNCNSHGFTIGHM
ncbi:MAG: HNH endonuclease [Cenarchaeum symbiont of Oopsacas minuta]|nr:HNH endonuclease [Cenarchaeum symbiont of Oopsacas minuta]